MTNGEAEDRFSFEDLEIWQEAVDFADRCLEIAEKLPHRNSRLIGQFETAATSPALNIAEGKGRYSKKEFMQFLYVARGSLFETVALLVIFRRRGWLPQEDYLELRKAGARLGKRISALMTSLRQSTGHAAPGRPPRAKSHEPGAEERFGENRKKTLDSPRVIQREERDGA